jgi:hypothetical protein
VAGLFKRRMQEFKPDLKLHDLLDRLAKRQEEMAQGLAG